VPISVLFVQPKVRVAAFAFGTGRITSTEKTATKTTSKVKSTKIVRFINILLDFSYSGQVTTHIRVGANLTRVSPAPAPTVQMECRNRQIPLGFSIILIRKRKAIERKEKVPLQGVIVESTP